MIYKNGEGEMNQFISPSPFLNFIDWNFAPQYLTLNPTFIIFFATLVLSNFS